MSNQEPSLFIVTSKTRARLGIVRTQLQNLFPLLPHLYVTRRETRLFVAAYVDAYATYLREHGERATLSTARAFAKTPQAHIITQDVKNRVDTILSTRVVFYPQEVSEFLGVGRSTITDWYASGLLTAVNPRRSRQARFIPASELRTALEWKLPNVN